VFDGIYAVPLAAASSAAFLAACSRLRAKDEVRQRQTQKGQGPN
jgi:hypothetical protein